MIFIVSQKACHVSKIFIYRNYFTGSDPEVIIIGGGVSKAGAILINSVQKYFTEYALFVSENVKIKQAVLGNDAGMYGAAGIVANR